MAELANETSYPILHALVRAHASNARLIHPFRTHRLEGWFN